MPPTDDFTTPDAGVLRFGPHLRAHMTEVLLAAAGGGPPVHPAQARAITARLAALYERVDGHGSATEPVDPADKIDNAQGALNALFREVDRVGEWTPELSARRGQLFRRFAPNIVTVAYQTQTGTIGLVNLRAVDTRGSGLQLQVRVDAGPSPEAWRPAAGTFNIMDHLVPLAGPQWRALDLAVLLAVIELVHQPTIPIADDEPDYEWGPDERPALSRVLRTALPGDAASYLLAYGLIQSFIAHTPLEDQFGLGGAMLHMERALASAEGRTVVLQTADPDAPVVATVRSRHAPEAEAPAADDELGILREALAKRGGGA